MEPGCLSVWGRGNAVQHCIISNIQQSDVFQFDAFRWINLVVYGIYGSSTAFLCYQLQTREAKERWLKAGGTE
ncbi:hypothetical protein KSB_79970 [Ktedonobacter robiniae]|uniref:Uncharacterized protein n=1 Tax=Ktedonobacter robiniae TaxID=2778365 RepID=A0ABQ3V435_9CHLR|nr:hypothetical protein KSB_79970 [Ktedonobacter robiniae]